MSPVLKFISGIVGGLSCFGFVLVAHRMGVALEPVMQDGLIVGGALSLGVTIWGAKQMPGDPPAPPPGGAP